MNIDIFTMEMLKKEREEELKGILDNIHLNNVKKPAFCKLPIIKKFDYCQCKCLMAQ